MKADLTEQYNKIYQYCYLRVHNRSLAEDLTQETFLRYLGQISDIKMQSLKPAAEIPVEKQLANYASFDVLKHAVPFCDGNPEK